MFDIFERFQSLFYQHETNQIEQNKYYGKVKKSQKLTTTTATTTKNSQSITDIHTHKKKTISQNVTHVKPNSAIWSSFLFHFNECHSFENEFYFGSA